MPDSGWIRALREAGLPFFGVLLVCSLGLSFVWRCWPELVSQPFEGARKWSDTIAVASAFAVIAQLVWLAFKAPISLPDWVAVRILARRFRALPDYQKDFLRRVQQSGKRRFDLPSYNERWIEELAEKGFIESVLQLVIVPGTPFPFEVTRPAWKALERVRGK